MDENTTTTVDEGMANMPPPSAVVFTFKKREPIQIELDMDALTWEDNIHFSEVQDKADRGEISQSEAIKALTAMLSKLSGQDVGKLPMGVVSGMLVEFKRLAEARTEELKN